MRRVMAWPAVEVVGGGEAFAASQPATGVRSSRHDRHCFGRLEQEDQRLKKHYGRWMDIIILRVIRRHFLACEDIAGGSDLSAGGTFF